MHAIQGVASLLVQPSRTEHPSEFTYGCGCFDSLSDGSGSTPAMCSPTSCDGTVRLISDGFCPGRQLFFAAFRSSRHGHATRVQCARGCESIEPAWTPPDAYLVPLGGLVAPPWEHSGDAERILGSFAVALKVRMKCRWERPITSPEPQTCPNRSSGTLRRGVNFSAGKRGCGSATT
jgi:hypothetical protein